MKKLHMNCHHADTNAGSSLPVIEVQNTSRPNSPPVTSQEQPSQESNTLTPLLPFQNVLDHSEEHKKKTDSTCLKHLVSKSLPMNACTATTDDQSSPNRSPFGCSSECGTHEKVKATFCSESVLFKRTVKPQ